MGGSTIKRVLVIALTLLLAAALSAAADSSVYKVTGRSAEELAEVVRPILVDGSLTVDRASNSLVLVGPADQVKAALELCTRLDRPLRTVRIEVRVVEKERLEQSKIGINWSMGQGNYRIGTTSEDPAPSGFIAEAIAEARHLSTGRDNLQFLIVPEGGEGRLAAGTSIPVTDWLIGYNQNLGHTVAWQGAVQVTTGFMVSPRIMGEDRILVVLTPWASYLSEGQTSRINYREAQTTVAIKDGGYIVLAEMESETGKLVSSMIQGFSDQQSSGDWSMVLKVKIQP